jgi:hypothetical protein
MKTSKLTSAIAIPSLVLFMSIASIANTRTFYSGDLPKSDNKSISVANPTEKDFSYLRFDVNKYISEDETAEVIHSSLEYLHFDVNEFIDETDAEAMELPMANEFEYLRFDVNNFTESHLDSMIELPMNEFDYLRFDVSHFLAEGDNAINELPLTE